MNARKNRKRSQSRNQARHSSRVSEQENVARENKGAIVSPAIDLICSGGLSLLISIYVIVWGSITSVPIRNVAVVFQLYMISDVLINGPHFMASYRLLYKRPGSLRRHPLVAGLIPLAGLLLIGYVTYCCFMYPQQSASSELPILFALGLVAPVFLGWHYVGQAWGMTASFAFLSGFRLDPSERRLIRAGLYVLFVYHVVLSAEGIGVLTRLFGGPNGENVVASSMFAVCRVASIIGFVLGVVGFWKLAKRTQRSIPIRVWTPWLATFSWYVMVDVHPASIFLVQGFHALQYVMFPMRVEINQSKQANWQWLRLGVYYVALVVTGLVAFHWSEILTVADSKLQIATAIFAFLNLHHYFIDAVIWKIRDPYVRDSLFGHLDAG